MIHGICRCMLNNRNYLRCIFEILTTMATKSLLDNIKRYLAYDNNCGADAGKGLAAVAALTNSQRTKRCI